MLRCAAAGDPDAFAAALPLLTRVLRDASPEDLWRDYADSTAQLWIALDDGAVRAAGVTQATGDTLHLWLCAGDGCDWRAIADAVAAVARGRFARMTIDGRRGWARLLGFSRDSAGLMEREIK